MIDVEKLRGAVKILSEKSSKNLDMVSLYIPPNKYYDDVLGFIGNEQKLSEDIKDAVVRRNVIGSLSTIVLKLIHFGEEERKFNDGISFFSGNTSLSIVEPEKKLRTFLYRVDSKFYLEPYEYLLEE